MPTKTTNTKPAPPPAAKAKAPAAQPVKAPPAKPAKAPARKPVGKSAGKRTVIIAKVNVGWGNSVYLRGAGANLSWDMGVRMDCVRDDEWTWACPAGAGPVTFKFVRNDLHWALGENEHVKAGATSVSTPEFPPW